MASGLLSAIEVRNTKPGDKPRKLRDGNGLNLLVHSNGSEYFQIRYTLHGKEKTLQLGVYLTMGLADARAAAKAARQLVADGIDPVSNAEQELRKIAQAIEIRIRQGEFLSRIRQQEADAKRHREFIAGHIDCLLRLVHDHRMRDAYLLLIPEISTDKQWRSLINCACMANDDFEDFRKRLKLAEEAKEEVDEAGEKFATALRGSAE